ncbi:MAG: hypothetical protein UZ15_CFX003002015 [Chloroflexi bacterium OLB15]|nr:MAG: hypothetical protein UZ15_CFX003002015 [Chloroflexi bacterium OLB15]
MQYQLPRSAPPSRGVRLLRALGVIILGAVLLLLGYMLATHFLRIQPGSYPIESINNILYFPLLTLQILLSIASLLLTTGTVSREQRLQHWDNLRATPSGTDLMLRTRWASVFYRLRGLLGIVIAGRVLLLACMLYDLTSFQGRYIDLLINGVIPEVSVITAVLLLALLMTASILLPITAIGLDTSLGLFISTTVQQRTYNTLLQLLLIIVRIGVTAALLYGVSQFLGGQLQTSDPAAWLLMFSAAAFGDWGLGMLYLGRAGEIWATVPYGIFIGLALVIFCFAQAYLTDQILVWAVKRAQKQG